MIVRRTALMLATLVRDHGYGAKSCIQVRPDGLVAATDGAVALRITDKAPFEDIDFPNGPGTKDPILQPTAPVYLLPEAVDALLKGMPKKPTIAILASVQFQQLPPTGTETKDARPIVRASTTDLVARQVLDIDSSQVTHFPDVDRVFTEAGAVLAAETFKVRLGVEMLETLVKVAKTLEPKYSRAIEFTFPVQQLSKGYGSGMIGLSFRGGAPLQVEGVTMPFGPED